MHSSLYTGKTIFMTGANGYLGRGLSRKLKELGATVVGPSSKEANLTDQTALDPFAATRFDYIFHLAAWTQAGEFCLTHMGEQWLINQQMNSNMLVWWHRHQKQAKFISIGTSCSYPTDLRLTEENYLLGTPIKDLYTYAMTKRMLLIGQQGLAAQFGMKWLTVIPSTIYGPGYITRGKQAHFIFDLIKKMLRAKNYGDPVILWGDGYQKRELVYREDVVNCLLELHETQENTIVNLGGGEEYSIRDFARMICEIIDLDPETIQYDTSKYVGARSKFLETDKLHALLPDYSPMPLKEGLRATIEFMKTEGDFAFTPSLPKMQISEPTIRS